MKTFLEFVAEDIISKQGTDLSRTAIVFPNKRASLFINEHLARLADRPSRRSGLMFHQFPSPQQTSYGYRSPV